MGQQVSVLIRHFSGADLAPGSYCTETPGGFPGMALHNWIVPKVMRGMIFPCISWQVGDSVVGKVVQIYCPGGISVDVGCSETLAFLEVEEIRLGRCTCCGLDCFE